jgi:hypothetical protein
MADWGAHQPEAHEHGCSPVATTIVRDPRGSPRLTETISACRFFSFSVDASCVATAHELANHRLIVAVTRSARASARLGRESVFPTENRAFARREQEVAPKICVLEAMCA